MQDEEFFAKPKPAPPVKAIPQEPIQDEDDFEEDDSAFFEKAPVAPASRPRPGRPPAPAAIVESVGLHKRGTVQRWIKTHGFIDPEDCLPNERGLFFHFSNIVGDGYRELPEGTRVTFRVAKTSKGPSAVEVEVIQ